MEEPGTPPNPPSAASPAPAAGSGDGPEAISIDEFSRVELRVGRIVEAAPHEKADRLLVLQVDVGEESPRQIVAGIRASWSPDELLGRTIVVATNLKPARLRGVESRGMLLAVKGTEKVIPLGVDGAVAPGTRVT